MGRELRDLQADQRDLQRRLRAMEDERQELEEERNYARERAERAVAGHLERLEAQTQTLEQRLGAAREDRDRLAGQLDQRQDALRQFAGRAPEEVLTELLALRSEREQLRQQLRRRPSDDAMQRLRLLEAERDDWDAERLQAVQRAQELELRLHRASVAVTELETLRDHKVSLETQTTLLRTALRELQADVDKHITSAEGKVIFPACADLDARAELHEQPVLDPERPDLRPFISELQLRIASDSRQPLQYSLETLRSFVAGLAMSRLHLLQGISGTGQDQPAAGLRPRDRRAERRDRGAVRLARPCRSGGALQRFREAVLRVRVPAGAVPCVTAPVQRHARDARPRRDEPFPSRAVFRQHPVGPREP